MTMQSFHATSAEQIDECARVLKACLPKKGWKITFTPWRDRRTLSQNDFQHAIYRDLSNYLIIHGRRECSPEWVKFMLKNKFLGWVDTEIVDIVTGDKCFKEVLRSTATLDVGEACDYTEKIIAWAESIGCHIMIPANSEYMKLREAQNA